MSQNVDFNELPFSQALFLMLEIKVVSYTKAIRRVRPLRVLSILKICNILVTRVMQTK